jgi:hypothetical protein
MIELEAIRPVPAAWPSASIASTVMQRVMIQADRTLLERAQRAADERGVSFPQLVRESLEHELGVAQTKPISCAGVISTGGRARGRTYEPDAWR